MSLPRRSPALDRSLETLLAEQRGLVVEQSARGVAENVFGFEQRNAYSVMTPDGRTHAFVAEESGAISRQFLGSRRPFVAHVVMRDGASVLELHRPFTLLFPELLVRSVGGDLLGRVHGRFSLLRRLFDLHDETGKVFARISSPLLSPWTFTLLAPGGTGVGSITKKWSGLVKEAFTDADTFTIDFGARSWTTTQRATILGATLLIDYTYFERGGR